MSENPTRFGVGGLAILVNLVNFGKFGEISSNLSTGKIEVVFDQTGYFFQYSF